MMAGRQFFPGPHPFAYGEKFRFPLWPSEKILAPPQVKEHPPHINNGGAVIEVMCEWPRVEKKILLYINISYGINHGKEKDCAAGAKKF